MKIKKITLKDKKDFDKFDKSEWEIFNKENNYKWKDKKISFVALDNKKIIGILRLKINGGATYIEDIIVKKNFRKNGVGFSLIQTAEAVSKENKCHVIYLQTTEKHKSAIKFYKKMKFKKVATLKKNKNNFDCYFFEKRLK